MPMRQRKSKKPHERKQSVRLTGREWSEILAAIDIQLMDLNDEWPERAKTLNEIEAKILDKVILPPIDC